KLPNESNTDMYLVTTLEPIPLQSFCLQLLGLSNGDREALGFIIKPAKCIYEIFYHQVLETNPILRDWLQKSNLDENEPFLTTKDSAVKFVPEAIKAVRGWKGLEYKVGFPSKKPPGANFYPSDMDKKEFELWKSILSESQQEDAKGFFTVIRRKSESESSLTKAAEQLHKATDLATTPRHEVEILRLQPILKKMIEKYLWGRLATFESFIGVRDDEGSARIKMFGENMLVYFLPYSSLVPFLVKQLTMNRFGFQRLDQNLPMDDQYKSTEVKVSPICVIQLIYNSGDVDGPQINAFNLPNDECIVKDRGTSMVIFKYIQEAKQELQELNTVLEEAKADILGLWALRFFTSQGLLPKSMLESMYVSFLSTCLRAVRFGLQEAHGRGQALQFNWLFGKEAIVLNSDDDTFSVDFTKVEEAVESLSREIMTIQTKGDKQAAIALLQKYGQMTPPLKLGLDKLEKIQSDS
ncbi:Nudix hydrolase 3, partial [Linum grandiflorum]